MCVIFRLIVNYLYLCGYYGWPAPMAVAFWQPCVDIPSNVFILFVGSFVVNKILSFLSLVIAVGQARCRLVFLGKELTVAT